MPKSFSQIKLSEVNEAYNLLQRVAGDIQSKGRKQRITNTSRETYRRWQSEGANYGIRDCPDGPLIGLVTLTDELLSDWPDHEYLGPISMLRALATHPDFSGKKVGEFAVQKTIALRDPGTSIYLDCVSDFLPSYYSRFGFKPIAQQIRDFGDEGTYDITLMRFCQRTLE